MIYDSFKREISVVSLQERCHSLTVAKAEYLYGSAEGTRALKTERQRGDSQKLAPTEQEKNPLGSGKRILLNHEASQRSFGVNTRDQAQALEHQHCELLEWPRAWSWPG